MAAVTTITSKEYSNRVKIVTCNFVADASGTVFTDGLVDGVAGKILVGVYTTPGSTGPTDNCDLTITDSLSERNLVASNGANSVDNATVNYVAPDTDAYIVGYLTVVPDASTENAVNEAETTVTLIIQG